MKKHFILFFSFLFVFALAACGGQKDPSGSKEPEGSSGTQASKYVGEKVSSVNEARIFKVGNETEPNKMMIYNVKDCGDVPYIDATSLKEIFSTEADVNLEAKTTGQTVTLNRTNNTETYITFDAATNVIKYNNISKLSVDASQEKKNPYGYDYCLSAGQVIRSSNKTKIGTTGKDLGQATLNNYNLKMVYEDGKVFVPLDLAISISQPCFLHSLVFNGKDLFIDPHNYKDSTMTSLCYSSNGNFLFGYVQNGEKYEIPFTKVQPTDSNQEYLFYLTNSTGQPDNSMQLILNKDGTGKIVRNENGVVSDYVNADRNKTIAGYKLIGDELNIYIKFVDEGAEGMKPSADFNDFVLRVNMKETRYGKKTRSQELADYTYNLLCFNYDNLYAIKSDRNITSFDAYITEQNLKTKLKSTDIDTYQTAMYEFLHVKIDDGHTNMMTQSIYDFQSSYKMRNLYETYKSTRTNNIMGKANNNYSQRFSSYNYSNGGIRMEEGEDTAYLAFDSFTVGGFGIPSNFKSFVGDSDPADYINSDTCAYMASSILKIEKYNQDSANTTKIKNIVVDISANIGGNMVALPYVACIMTKDPALCMGDSRNGQVIEYHYEADFDGDGVYGDSYADKYNFFLLTSDASFSCGSSLPSMLKGTNVKIIGKKGAGGACPITTFVDGSGIVYQTSGHMGVYYKNGTDYLSIENGVPVDYELEPSEWYDYVNLTKKIDGWVSQSN